MSTTEKRSLLNVVFTPLTVSFLALVHAALRLVEPRAHSLLLLAKM